MIAQIMYNLILHDVHRRSDIKLMVISLIGFSRVDSFIAGITAANREDSLFRNATAWYAGAHYMGDLTRQPARVHLTLAQYTAPAHSIIIIITAFDWTATTLIM